MIETITEYYRPNDYDSIELAYESIMEGYVDVLNGGDISIAEPLGSPEVIDPWSPEAFKKYIIECSNGNLLTCVEFGNHNDDVGKYEVTISFDTEKSATFDENLEIVEEQFIMNNL